MSPTCSPLRGARKSTLLSTSLCGDFHFCNVLGGCSAYPYCACSLCFAGAASVVCSSLYYEKIALHSVALPFCFCMAAFGMQPLGKSQSGFQSPKKLYQLNCVLRYYEKCQHDIKSQLKGEVWYKMAVWYKILAHHVLVKINTVLNSFLTFPVFSYPLIVRKILKQALAGIVWKEKSESTNVP